MNYLVCLQPPLEILEQVRIYREDHSSYFAGVPSSPIHSTLMATPLQRSNEEQIIRSLEGVSFDPFEIEMGMLSLFDGDSLVAQLEKSYEIARLHETIIKTLKEFICWEEVPPCTGSKEQQRVHEEYGSPYYAEFYHPHITLAHLDPKSEFVFDEAVFLGKRWTVEQFYLLKKESEKHEHVREFLA